MGYVQYDIWTEKKGQEQHRFIYYYLICMYKTSHHCTINRQIQINMNFKQTKV